MDVNTNTSTSGSLRSRTSFTNTVSWEDEHTVVKNNGTNHQNSFNSNGKDKPKEDREDDCNGEAMQDNHDQLIMDVLRKIVRTCTTADKSKRPSANEIYDLLNTLM